MDIKHPVSVTENNIMIENWDISQFKFMGNTTFLSYQNQKTQFIKNLEIVLEKNFHKPNLCIKEIASSMAMPERQLYRKSKIYLSTTPNNYLKDFRLDQAIELVSLGVHINIVSTDVGFSSHSYFCRCFKARYNFTKHCFIGCYEQLTLNHELSS